MQVIVQCSNIQYWTKPLYQHEPIVKMHTPFGLIHHTWNNARCWPVSAGSDWPWHSDAVSAASARMEEGSLYWRHKLMAWVRAWLACTNSLGAWYSCYNDIEYTPNTRRSKSLFTIKINACRSDYIQVWYTGWRNNTVNTLLLMSNIVLLITGYVAF